MNHILIQSAELTNKKVVMLKSFFKCLWLKIKKIMEIISIISMVRMIGMGLLHMGHIYNTCNF